MERRKKNYGLNVKHACAVSVLHCFCFEILVNLRDFF